MIISTRGRYALRLMIDLAIHQDEGNISLKDISKRQDISIKYLEQIVKPLTKKPSENTAKDILTVLEGPIACVTCLEDPVNKCPRFKSCPTISFYEGLNKLIND